MKTAPKKIIPTRALGNKTLYMGSSGKWTMWHAGVEYVFEHVKTYGPSGEFWFMPNGETARTLSLAVMRTARHIANASAVVSAFAALGGAS